MATWRSYFSETEEIAFLEDLKKRFFGERKNRYFLVLEKSIIRWPKKSLSRGTLKSDFSDRKKSLFSDYLKKPFFRERKNHFLWRPEKIALSPLLEKAIFRRPKKIAFSSRPGKWFFGDRKNRFFLATGKAILRKSKLSHFRAELI